MRIAYKNSTLEIFHVEGTFASELDFLNEIVRVNSGALSDYSCIDVDNLQIKLYRENGIVKVKYITEYELLLEKLSDVETIRVSFNEDNERAINFNENDLNTRFIRVHINEEYSLDDVTLIKAIFVKPDKTYSYIDVDKPINSKDIIVPIPSSVLAVKGIVEFNLSLYGENKKLTTGKMRINVKKALGEAEILASNEWLGLERILAELETWTVEEDIRKTSEITRISNEENRVNVENLRVTAENLRVTKENDRITKETARVSAENTRISNDSARTTNENTRVSNESARGTNESARVSAETNRATKETARINAETSRATAEVTRVNSENTRVSNETIRTASETARVNAENIRIANETARQTVYKEVEENRKGYDNKVYPNMYEARKSDYERLDNKFGDFTHSRFSGIGNFKVDNTKEGLIKDFNIKGRTLQNLCTYDKPSSSYVNVEENGDITIPYNTENLRGVLFNTPTLKDNTIYTMIIKFDEISINLGLTKPVKIHLGDTNYFDVITSGIVVQKLTTGSVANYGIKILVRTTDATYGNVKFNKKNVMLLEGDYTNIPISQLPYIDGIKSLGEKEVNSDNKYPIKVKSYGNDELEANKIEYLLDEPLRSLPNGICDEIVDNKLIRRVGKVVLNGSEQGYATAISNDTLFAFILSNDSIINNIPGESSTINIINNTLPNLTQNNGITNGEGISSRNPVGNLTGLYFRLSSNRLGESNTITALKTWLSQNPTTVYYELATPIITDIDAKTLKAYEGITNVSIDNLLVGEISAKVPTDLVTEIEANRKDFKGNVYPNMYEARIRDTSYLLDKINNAEYLEYSGTNITANNSYDGLVKNLSVKGRTFQNLWKYKQFEVIKGSTGVIKYQPNILLKSNTTYTILFDVLECIFSYAIGITFSTSYENGTTDWLGFSVNNDGLTTGQKIYKFTTKDSTPTNFGIGIHNNNVNGDKCNFNNVIILEGDYTNTPINEIPYIEGIKSTGETELIGEKYRIDIKSCGKNLATNIEYNKYILSDGTIEDNFSTGFNIKFTNYKLNTNYRLKCEDLNGVSIRPYYYDKNGVFIFKGEPGYTFNTLNFDGYIRINVYVSNGVKQRNWQLEEGITATNYEPYIEDTKYLLLDEPLRSLPNGVCDEILDDGTEIRRVGKVVLDGSEDWQVNSVWSAGDFYGRYLFINDRLKGSLNFICSNYKMERNVKNQILTDECFFGEDNSKAVYISIKKTKLATIDKQGFINYLQTNPTTIYYELETPIITKHDINLSLRTYDSTTHITSDNYLLPKITAKVPSNVQAVVTNLMSENEVLNKEVSTLNIENKELKETNDIQDEMIDINLSATDEMYMMLEPLLAQSINTLSINGGENKMVDLYVAMVQRGLKTIDEVPVRYRDEVTRILEELEK